MKNTNDFIELDLDKQKEEIDILFNEVKLYTDLYLDEICKGKATPYICKLKDTKEGRASIHQYVINCIFNYNNFDIGEALMEMERGLNPNMIND